MMIGYLLLVGSLNMAAAPADDAIGERFQSASANLALDSIRANIHLLQSEPNAQDQKIVPRVKKSLDDLIAALGEERALEIAKGEDRTFAAKLVALALHRKNHPKLYEDVGKVYGSDEFASELPNGVKEWKMRYMPNRLPIRKAHVAEEYRLVWEFRLLLLPGMGEIPTRGAPSRVGGYSELADERPINQPSYPCSQPTMEGLYRTGNGKSIVTLVEFYKLACRDDSIGIAEQTVRDVFGCLEHYGTDKALAAVLECAEWTEVQWDMRYARYAKKSGTVPVRTEQVKPVELVTGLAKDDVKRVWLKLAEKLPTEPLSKRQKEMLAALKAEYKDRK